MEILSSVRKIYEYQTWLVMNAFQAYHKEGAAATKSIERDMSELSRRQQELQTQQEQVALYSYPESDSYTNFLVIGSMDQRSRDRTGNPVFYAKNF